MYSASSNRQGKGSSMGISISSSVVVVVVEPFALFSEAFLGRKVKHLSTLAIVDDGGVVLGEIEEKLGRFDLIDDDETPLELSEILSPKWVVASSDTLSLLVTLLRCSLLPLELIVVFRE